MDYTVEFDSELLEQFPQEVHLAYKKTISKKVIEHVDHNFFRIKPIRTRSAKGISEMKVNIDIKNYSIAFSFNKNPLFLFYIILNLLQIEFDKDVNNKINSTTKGY
ncbi:hypothetical protein HQ620_12910 [Enterococcus faecium]|nr:hypothetical protein [Enterococcus faecium]